MHGGGSTGTAAAQHAGRLKWALGLTATYMVAEVVGGLVTGSLALLADAAHMMTDVGGLALALLAIRFAAREATPQRTYGYLRMEVLSALTNAVVLLLLTVYILYWLFVTLDNIIDVEPLVGVDVPGLGVAVSLVAITLVGLLASNILTRWVVTLMDRMFQRMPLAKLIYTSLKDLTEAFFGEKKRFDKPVLVSLGPEVGGEILGFVTRENLAWLARDQAVAVYFPQSYNFAGSVVIFPRDRLTPIDADSGDVMKFIVSGGVSGG